MSQPQQPRPSLGTGVIFDYSKIGAFFRTVARARALEHRTKMVWKDHTGDSPVFGVAYALMPWKGDLGMADVTVDRKAVERDTEQFHQEYMSGFAKKLIESPAAAVQYADRMARLRASCLDTVQDVYRDAVQINRDVTDEVGFAIRTLSAIQFGATLALNVAAVPSGIGANLVTTLYSLGVNWANSPSEAAKADMVLTAETAVTGMAGATVSAGGQGLQTLVDEAKPVTQAAYKKLVEAGKPANDRVLASLKSLGHKSFAASALKVAGTSLSVVFAGSAIINAWNHHMEIDRASR